MFEQDLLQVSYDPKRLTPEQILEAVRKEGLQGTILPAESPGGGGN